MAIVIITICGWSFSILSAGFKLKMHPNAMKFWQTVPIADLGLVKDTNFVILRATETDLVPAGYISMYRVGRA